MASPFFSRLLNSVHLDREKLQTASAFLAGFGYMFTVPVGGKLPLGEIVLLPWFLYVVLRRFQSGAWPHPLLQGKTFRHLLIALGLTLVGYVASDLYRGSIPGDYLRGWARIVFLTADMVALSYLVGCNWYNVRTFVFGLIFGSFASLAIDGPLFNEYWKFGFAYPLTYLLAIALPQRRPMLVALGLVAFGILHIYLGARSLGATCMLAGVFTWLSSAPARLRLALVICGLGVGAYLVERVYTESGVGEEKGGSDTERTAMLQYAAAKFFESPVFGQGSWFTKSSKLDDFYARRAELRGEADVVNEHTVDHEVAVHSQLLIGLAEGGLLGGAFFLALALLLARTGYFAVTQDFTLRPLVILLLLQATWDLLMSPFSGGERLLIALTCALLISLRGLRRLQKGQV